ncbi:DUF2332 family protein [Novosphingobium sp. SL115]|uniref:DUF2332 domain-containing protein n=1 Tax=Novosphingobium sp. SL115 TaxID=2995150 RepID=UPI002274BFA0|nr:DUF2332 family protein [Novosphingobium sp. SL115]MCY1672951.1 DUF2332 family protein [Novosphingobium sp. SL115]
MTLSILAPIDPAPHYRAEPAEPGSRTMAQLRVEADKAHGFGKPFVAAVLESLERVLPVVPSLLHMVEDWPGDLAPAGVIFRLNAGLHALARSGRHPQLQRIYAAAGNGLVPDAAQLDLAIALALAEGEADLGGYIARPTQTNEVGRIAGLAAVLMELNARTVMPSEILELGSSAGLNLNLDRYACNVFDTVAGNPRSRVRIAPRWTGRKMPSAPVPIAATRGVDLHPLDVAKARHRERLHAYVWPCETARDQRLSAAIAIARRHPPRVDRGTATAWLDAQLASPQRESVRRVVFHSMVVQYMPEAERIALRRTLARAGAAATPQRPLVAVGLEWSGDRKAVELRVRQWNGGAHDGAAAIVAWCHPYAEWFDWIGLPDA